MHSSAEMERSELLSLDRWADLGERPIGLCLCLIGPVCERSEFMATGVKTSVARNVEIAECRHRICASSARAEGVDESGLRL